MKRNKKKSSVLYIDKLGKRKRELLAKATEGWTIG